MSFLAPSTEWTSATARELWGLGPGVAYLDHASWGCVPRPVREEQDAWNARASANPARFFRTELDEAVHDARVAAAGFCGVQPEEFGLLTTIREAVEVVLDALPLRRGDDVVVTTHIDPRLRSVVERAAERRGAHVVTAAVPAMADLSDWESALFAAVTERTRVVILEQITAATAELVPVQALTRTLRAHSFTVLVDGSQSIGMIGDSIARFGADVWLGAFHLWACAPRGAVGLWVSPDADLRLEAPDSYLSGGVDLAAWCALPKAFRFLRELDLPRLRANNAVLAAYGQTVVAESLSIPLGDLPGHPRLSVRAIPLPAGYANTPRRAADLSARIAATLKSEVGVASMGGRGWLRLSAQAYNNAEEYDWLTYGLRDVISSART